MGKAGKALGSTVGGFVGDISGANAAANAAQRAGMAQQSEAIRQRQELKDLTEGVTVQGIANFDRALAAQEKNLARQEQLLSQIDPTVMEASQQALRLLRGESSSSLAPLQKQRDTQRQKLLNTLRAQLGPGAETSTAGIQALTRFDAETDSLFSGAQQQALQNVGNIFSQFNAGRPDLLREATGFGNLATGKAGLRFQQAGLMSGANQAVLGSAGAQYTGDLMRAQNQQAVIGQLGGLAGSALGGVVGGGLGAAMGGKAGGALGGGGQ